MNFGLMWREMPPVSKNLLIINLIIWAAINTLGTRMGNAIVDYGALHYFSSDSFYPYQLFTYMFMHEGFTHLFFNMFALFMFGGIIERTLGSARFLFYYISCGLGAALIQEGVFGLMINHYEGMLTPFPTAMNYELTGKIWMLENIPTLGASGAIYGILLAFGFLYPRQPIYLMFVPVPIQARWMVIGYGVIELLQTLNNNPSDNVAHLAHLGGMIFGLLMLLYWRHKRIIGGYRF